MHSALPLILFALAVAAAEKEEHGLGGEHGIKVVGERVDYTFFDISPEDDDYGACV